MRRLVYSPKAYAWVRSDNHGLVDLTPYIASGNVQRKTGMASTASLTIRNPNMMFTRESETTAGPYFKPMDPITIWLERMRGYPVQVFTGYLDQTPYLQLYPGTCELAASCTLKKLLHVYWDPALQFVNDWLVQYGWINSDGRIVNKAAEANITEGKTGEALQDGAIGQLLYGVLTDVADWPDNAIHIEKLPDALIEQIFEVYQAYNSDAEETKGQVKTFLKAYLGTADLGSGTTSPSSGGGPLSASQKERINERWKKLRSGEVLTDVEAAQLWVDAGGSVEDAYIASAMAVGESGRTVGRFNGSCCYGVWQIHTVHGPEAASQAVGAEWWRAQKAVELRNGSPNAWGINPWEACQDAACSPFIDAAAAIKRKVERQGGLDGPDSKKDTDEDRRGPTIDPNAGDQTTNASRKSPKAEDDEKIHLPVDKQYIDGYNNFGESRPGHLHDGEDFPAPAGANIYAVKSGKVLSASSVSGYGNYIRIEHADGYVTGYAHLQSIGVKAGEKVESGQIIGKCNNTGSSQGDHLHFNVSKDNSSSGYDNNVSPESYLKGAVDAQGGTGGDGGGGGGSGGASAQDILTASKAAAFVQDIEFPGFMEMQEAMRLTGARSLLNDVPLFPFVEQLSKASMRDFQSLPNGDFYAFYPDYFGHQRSRRPYWAIDDIEILDMTIQLSDEALATHVFAVGDVTHASSPGIDWFDRLFSTGVINIQNVVTSGFNPVPIEEKIDNEEKTAQAKARQGRIASDPAQTLRFLKKYGARPHVEEAPFIRSPYFEAFMAWQTFNLMWARQFATTAQFTFMPELFPGGLVEFPSHDLQVYVESVSHSFDYEGGFTTECEVSAPATTSMQGNADDPLSFGLVRAGDT